MKLASLVCAFAAGVAFLPVAALADDPNDPTMRSAAARARDSAIIKRMNQQQLAYVRKRDAQQTPRVRPGDRAAYADARAEYDRKMAAWRRAVAACNAGRWEYCDN